MDPVQQLKLAMKLLAETEVPPELDHDPKERLTNTTGTESVVPIASKDEAFIEVEVGD